MKKMKVLGLAAVCLSFIVLAGTSAIGQDAIRIGTLYPFTGPLAMFGTELSPEPGLRPVFNLALELAVAL
jgi:hypothetical protein